MFRIFCCALEAIVCFRHLADMGSDAVIARFEGIKPRFPIGSPVGKPMVVSASNASNRERLSQFPYSMPGDDHSSLERKGRRVMPTTNRLMA